MKSRCHYPSSTYYCNYGARGITVCDDWRNNFVKFAEWSLSNGYKEDLTIDRVDNGRGYSPDNCRWVDRKTQNQNKRNSCIIEYNGEHRTMSEWSEMYNAPNSRVWARLRKLGWDLESALLNQKGQTLKRKARKVIQCDRKTGDALKVWDTTKSAANALNVSGRHIYSAANGVRKSAYGYAWKFKEEL
jgi:hypothetical protein